MPSARPKYTLPTLAALLLVAAATITCGGSSKGGGAANPAPVLVACSFIGAGANPVAGDHLRLTMSEPVNLNPGLLDDTKLAISGGGTLGAVAVNPTVVSNNTVDVVLGTGVSLTAGSTTIDFAPGSNLVKDLGGVLAAPSTPRTLSKADADAPVITALTLSDVDATLNGTGVAGGTLQVPSNGFTIDVSYTDASAVDPAASSITASVVVVVNGLGVAAGNNLTGSLTPTATAGKVSYLVPSTVVFPTTGAVTLTVQLVDVTGQNSSQANFSFAVRAFTSALRPFESGMTWFVDTSRDVESYAVNLANASTPVEITDGANARSDFDDLLRIIGLHHSTPIPNVDGSKDSNQVVSDLFNAEVVTQLNGFFTGTPVTFTFTAPGAWPGGDTIPYASGTFSQICVAGSLNAAGNSGVLGLAIFDEHNTVHVNDCSLNFAGSRLGVFLHTLINSGFKSSPSSDFRLLFDVFTPSRTGTPIGADANDGQRLMGTLTTGQRYIDIHAAIDNLARFTALIVAHECGHSMGLVKNGAMPDGIYGGDAVNFPGSQSGHISMPSSVFPGNAINIMTPAISYTSALDPGSGFNSLNLAYLRERVIYN